MLGDLIASLDRPGLANSVLASLEPELQEAIAARAISVSMQVPDFVAGAVKAFVDTAEDDLWFQLLTVMRKADDPGFAAVEQILEWVVTERPAATR
jgi:hypothetical protein